MIRKKKNYEKPRKPFEAGRIKDENVLVKKYGLKNKREIWKTIAKVNYFRTRAKALARSPIEEQEKFFAKLRALGLDVKTSADVLDLDVESLLDRRLATIVANKKLANSMKHARQMIVHKKITIDGKVMNAPSYIVTLGEESLIKVKTKNRVSKKEVEAEVQEAGDVQEDSEEEGE